MKRLISLFVVVLLGLAFVIPISSSWSAGTLKVTLPNGGQKWKTGNRYAIKWVKGNAGGTVKIQLLKFGKHHKWISKKTKNDGKYTWKIPTTVDSGSAYMIKIVSVKNKKIFDASNKNFTITKASGETGGPSSSYRYLKGIGKVDYDSFEDVARGIVIHDFNGDGYTDVGYGSGLHVRDECMFKPDGTCDSSKCTYKAGCRTSRGRSEIFLNDRKGRLNLKTKQAFTGKPLIWRNGGSFHVSVAYDPKMNGKSTLADLTGDGLADWLLLNTDHMYTPYKLPIIQLRPNGKLKAGPRMMPPISYHSGSLADIDNDGDLDLVYAHSFTFISYNNGRGKFTCKYMLTSGVDYPPYKMCFDQLDSNQPTLSPKHGWAYSALVIDLNKDGLPEVITANGNAVDPDLNDPYPSASGKILVFKNTGGKLGTFKKVQTIPSPGKWPDQKGRKFSVWAADTQAADLDGDGDLDGLFYYECGDFCSGTNPIVILKNLGNGKVKRWQIFNASPARGSYKGSDWNKLLGAPQVVDLNGDKRPDLVGNYAHNYNGSMKDAHKQSTGCGRHA